MKTIIIDGQTYELRPIEDKKQAPMYQIDYNHSITGDAEVSLAFSSNYDQMRAIRDAVEALMKEIYNEPSLYSLTHLINRAKELLEEK